MLYLRKKGYQEHHITTKGNKRLKINIKEHALWKAAGMDIESCKNKIFLPSKQGLHETRSVHRGGHVKKIYEGIESGMNKIMDKAKAAGIDPLNKHNQKYFQKQFLEFLNEERTALEHGIRILNNLPKSGVFKNSKAPKINKSPKL